MTNPVLHFDFTLNNPASGSGAVCSTLKELCRSWVFQKERGGLTNTPHYQGRIVLKEKMRLITLHNKLADGPLDGCHLSPTSKANCGNAFYVMKEDGRIEGPWSDKTVVNYIPQRVRDFQPFPWQEKVLEIAMDVNDRVIHVIHDPFGNTGKSTLVIYMATHGKACNIPPMKDHKDIMRMVMNKPKNRCYMIDLPRASDKRHMTNMWAAIETVKSGYAYDDRYEFKDEYFEPPNIIVFTNIVPDRSLLSEDRWIVWSILNNELVPHSE